MKRGILFSMIGLCIFHMPDTAYGDLPSEEIHLVEQELQHYQEADQREQEAEIANLKDTVAGLNKKIQQLVRVVKKQKAALQRKNEAFTTSLINFDEEQINRYEYTALSINKGKTEEPLTVSSLHLAIHGQDYQRALELIALNPRIITSQDADGNTPLHLLLLRKSGKENATAYDRLVKTIIHHELFIPNLQNERGNTVLHIAVAKNYQYGIDLLFNNQCLDRNVRNAQGKTPLDLALKEQQSWLKKQKMIRGALRS